MYDLILFLLLLMLGFFIGRHLEQRHYRSIREREALLVALPVSDLKHPLNPDFIATAQFVSGNVVISVDYFKRFMAGLYNLVGGNISTYETLLDRARREAILRMKESVSDADEIVNLRIETSSISKNSNRGTIGSIEVFAYGTAITYK